MGENLILSQGELGESKSVTWRLEKWSSLHKIYAASPQSNCFVELGDPKIGLRFFLKPVTKEKRMYQHQNYTVSVVAKWYALWAEVRNPLQNTIVMVQGTEPSTSRSTDGCIDLSTKEKKVEVIQEFLHVSSAHRDPNAVNCTPKVNGCLNTPNLDIKLTVTLHHLSAVNNNTTGAATSADVQLAEAEASLIDDLKNMFAAEDNFSDLKLESKDNITLSAHRFLLAARSDYFRERIESAMKTEGFNGTLKIDVNAKPMIVILHWMYTGDLHENAGNVMEEVVDLAVQFGLSHLLKVLDKKLVTICDKGNMFRLYQVAQKVAMPTAMEDISAFIRENI